MDERYLTTCGAAACLVSCMFLFFPVSLQGWGARTSGCAQGQSRQKSYPLTNEPAPRLIVLIRHSRCAIMDKVYVL